MIVMIDSYEYRRKEKFTPNVVIAAGISTSRCARQLSTQGKDFELEKRLLRMNVGVCYFPEHWPRERWQTDLEQMAEAGIEYVRMGEFSWSRLEPEPDELDFEWLETVVDGIAERGMKAVLCTPTATPPKWLVDRHPEILQEEPDGTVRAFGGRRHYCFNSEAYHEQTERIVSALAERFAEHPAVVGWQTDNEFGCHGTLRCYCEDCADAFREWLRDEYGDVETLNEAWGTSFWSQHHTDFEEIDPPRHTAADHHPSRLLDYHRFSSDSVVEYNRLQADLLRSVNDDWFVTHNFMVSFTPLNPFDVGSDLDFAAWDVYPTGFPQTTPGTADTDELRVGNPDQLGFNHDLYRCAAPGEFWVMEQQPGEINWPPITTQPADGAMRLWAHHAVAHGAAVVSYFRWRRCLEGQEQYHSGLRKRDGSADRGYHDASVTAAEFETLESGNIDTPVALLLDYDSLWALDEQPMSPSFNYWEHIQTYYSALRGRGVDVDIVPPNDDLSTYDAVVAPTLYLADTELALSLSEYVERGGSLLLTMRSGEKDRSNKLHPTTPPGPFAGLVGATVEQHESVDGLETMVQYGGETYGYRTWAEWLADDNATIVGEYTTGTGTGRAAITERTVGDGRIVYVGVWPSEDLADALVTDLLQQADVEHTDRLPERVRIAERGDLTWIFNYSNEKITIDTGASFQIGESTISEYDLAVVEGSSAEITVEDDN